MIDVSKDRIIVDVEGGTQRTFEKKDFDEIIVKSDTIPDVFSFNIYKPTVVKIDIYTLSVTSVSKSDNKLLIHCKDTTKEAYGSPPKAKS